MMEFGVGLRWILFLPLLIAAADLVHLDDSTRRIPNSHLTAYFLCAGFAYTLPAGYPLFTEASPWPPLGGFYGNAAAHGAIAVTVAIGMWRMGLWPAGDAKLFMLLALWMPVLDPFSPLLPWKMTLAMLINIFIPAALFVVLRTMWWVWREKLRGRARFLFAMGLRRMPDYLRESQRELMKSLRAGFARARAELAKNPGTYGGALLDGLAMTLAGAAAMVWIVNRRDVSWLPGPLTGFVIFLVVDALRRLLGSRTLFWICLAGALSWGWMQALPGDGALLWRSWTQWAFFLSAFGIGTFSVRVFLGVSERFLVIFWIGMMFAMMVGPQLIGWAGPGGVLTWAVWGTACGLIYVLVESFLEEDSIEVKAGQLKPYDVLSTATLAEIKEADLEFYDAVFNRLYPDGLLPYQVEAVREWCDEYELKTVSLKRTLPFASWIFVGGALTLWMRWDLVSLLVKGKPGG